MRVFLYSLVLAAALVLFSMAICGCSPQTAATHAAIVATQQQSQVDIATEKAKAALLAQKAKDNPVAHPIASATAAVQVAQKPLGLIATVAFIACAVGVGLYFYTPLSWLSKILVPVGGAVSAFSFFGVIALPFLPWVFVGLTVLVVGLVIYEVIRAKSLKGGIEDLESDIGFGSTAIPSVLFPPSGSTATVKLSHL